MIIIYHVELTFLKWRRLENQPEAFPRSVSSIASYNSAYHCSQLSYFLDTKRVPGIPLSPSVLQMPEDTGLSVTQWMTMCIWSKLGKK